jgi:hypothetical protein
MASAVLADMYGSPQPPQPNLQPTYRAEQFIDSLALNADPFSRYLSNGPFKGAGTKYPPEVFFDLGIRYYRQPLKYDLTPPDIVQKVTGAYEKYGARPMMLIDPHKDGDPAGVVALLKQYPPGVIAEVEGPNELNNKFPPQELNMKYGGKTDEAAGAAYMDDYYKAIKSDPATRDIPVVAFTAIFTDYRLAKPHTSFDYSNMHSYQGYDVPSGSLEMNFTRFNNILPVGGVIKPFVPTECGYNVEEDVANHTGITGNLAAQAKNIPMLYAEYFRHGIRRTYLFALHNADGYGLLESDQATKRPAYFAVKNFVAALKDATWNPQNKAWEGGDFTPRALLFDLAGAPQSVHTLVLQKKSGEYSLLIWNEVPNYDHGAKKELSPAAIPVTLTFQTPLQPQATILTQNAKGEYDSSSAQLTGHALQLSVPSSVMIVRLMPQATATTPVPAPADVKGTASETDANLSWQSVPSAAGYFVFRNGWHIATTTTPQYHDGSSWLRPGLGYTYAVQAFDKSGNMSPRTEAVVQTAARFPDLIVTAFDPQTADLKLGEKIRFTATLKNIGQGSTPPGIQTGVTWSVDGKVIGWHTEAGPLKSGQQLNLVSGGPNDGLWTATRGGHRLKCVIDDINRLPGEYKGNNLYERTFTVGETSSPTKGLLVGSTQSAPGQVDLTREGTLDWIHWGLRGKSGIVHKATGQRLFSDLTPIGQGYLDATAGCPVSMKWSDGESPKAMADTHTGLWWNNVGTGRSFTVPADTTPRTLRLYVAGIEGAGGTLSAKLSDDSAPAYISNCWDGNAGHGDWAPVPDGFSAVYTIQYRAASPGQKLTVEWKLTSEPNRFRGQARMQAATLSE